MADIGYSVRSYLLSKSAITDLIGSRMYPDAMKKSATMPAVIYYVISSTHDHKMSDVAGMIHSRIEFDCYGMTRLEANEVADAIKSCGITGYRGTTQGNFINGVEIDSGDQYLNEAPTDGNQEHRYVTTFDLLVHYTEI